MITGKKKRVGRPKKTTTKTTNSARTSSKYTSMDEIAADVNVVLHSLIRQDGKFTVQEASAISKIYGNQLTLAKIKLDADKMHSSTSETATKDVLALR